MIKNKQKQDTSWVFAHKGMTAEDIATSFKVNRQYTLAKDQYSATTNDNFLALSLAIRDRIIERWMETQQHYHKGNVKRVYYLSMEFLIGRLMGNYMYSLGLEDACAKAVEELGMNLEELREQELDAGLGNGGLGRLAACFLDSMATLGIPAHGYGIRFDYGIFHQKIQDGFQKELPDEWLKNESPWQFARPEYSVKVRFGGRVNAHQNSDGTVTFEWKDTQDVLALPYDFPIPGYKNDVVNTLRLWSAKSSEDFDFEYFKHGDYERAVEQKISSEVISKVLYPSDDFSRGKELRLKQEYFMIAASINDIIRRFKSENNDLRNLPEHAVIQLNDTHPCLAIAELMRILLDDYAFSWAQAWEVTKKMFAYTNHTLMPEALEAWSVDLLGKLLPRHLQIIYEINAIFLDEVSLRYPGDVARLVRMSIIEEGEPKRVRMAYLAIVASFSINGVSELHSQLLKTNLLKDFYQFYPEKFNNKTNGITFRRWLLKSNPSLSALITKAIGNGWVSDADQLEKLLPFKEDASFRKQWQIVKQANKQVLARYIQKANDIIVDPQSIFDIQVKRIHEYKRQTLFAFYIISHYLKLKNDPNKSFVQRTFIMGGKAAPSYGMAKLTIKLFNSMADVINRDPSVADKMKLVFLENYRVSLAEKVFPASDLSEQISTAGTEASGTGNMKFMVNGALTIGTYDGANIEMAQRLGEDNMFIFGLRADEVERLKAQGYSSREVIERTPELKAVLQLISSNFFSQFQPGLFDPIVSAIYNSDTYMVCADFESYCRTHDLVDQSFVDKTQWTKKSIHNTAKSGYFSSDRTIREYAQDIWFNKARQ
ncbi:MAG: glycogen/starch/alpha-glucan phosphorylase [Candidatus Omnitrophota bacterium]